MIAFDAVVGFDWDEGNARKNEKHGVTQAEAEEVFLHRPLVLAPDAAHSSAVEPRFHALGVTGAGRRLHLTFTIRRNGSLVRVISARDMHRKERAIYDKAD
jgi:uncharacterized DUF497 family protein